MAPSLTWLITGAASGLGQQLAHHALAEGHAVVFTSRDPDRDSALAAAARAAGARWEQLDVDSPDCGSIIARLAAEGVEVDVLVSNAGWSLLGAVEAMSEADARSQMETLFFGPYRLVRAVVPRMRARGRGVVINVSSGAAMDGCESMGLYSAGKAATDALCNVLGKEVAPLGIRVVNVLLGGLNTNFSKAVRLATDPVPPGYEGGRLARMVDMVRTGGYVADGDVAKAAGAIYDLVTGEGSGQGKEAERLLILGRDMWQRQAEVRAGWERTAEVFGDTCRNIHRDDKPEFEST